MPKATRCLVEDWDKSPKQTHCSYFYTGCHRTKGRGRQQGPPKTATGDLLSKPGDVIGNYTETTVTKLTVPDTPGHGVTKP
jgi:hypothetical protein